MESINSDLDKAIGDLEEVERSAQEIRQKFVEVYRLVDKTVTDLESQQKGIRRLRDTVEAVNKDRNISKAQKEEMELKLKEIKQKSTSLDTRLVPGHGSVFVRLFLGQINVKIYRDKERFALKNEYEKFKGRTNVILILFAIMQLLLPSFRWIQVIFQVWLLYYYTTLALREHILRKNGSNIAEWWIVHHYISMMVCVAFLTWPILNSEYHVFLKQISVFFLVQGCVQVLLHQYQQGRLYTMVATGRASRMDVTGELLVPKFVPSLALLLPFILSVHLFQLFNAVTLLSLWWANPFVEWQVPYCGILSIFLGCGNLYTTVSTYYRKWSK